MADTKECFSCKWFNQAEGCCQCFNPEQTYEPYKTYVYGSFTCDLFTKGKQLNESEMAALGYVRLKKVIHFADGTKRDFYYYGKHDGRVAPGCVSLYKVTVPEKPKLFSFERVKNFFKK